MEGESSYTVEKAAEILGETPERILDKLASGELEGIPPGATVSGEWKVLLPTDHQQEAPSTVDQSPEGVLAEQEEASPADEPPESSAEDTEEPEDSVTPPPTSAAAVHVVGSSSDETHDAPSRVADEEVREEAGGSGWTTTKQAAKVLGVSRRSVQGYVGRGWLEAREEGEGVNKRFLISIDSLNALRDRRMREAGEAAKSAEASVEPERMANMYANTGEALRHAIERVEARTAEATELRIRLELTEKAESTLRAELEDERRMREEAERRREAAERELEELRRRLETRSEPRNSSVSPAPTETTTGADGGPQEAREATQGAAETLRGPPEPRPPAGGAQERIQAPPLARLRRGRLWRRVFGRR